MAWRSDQDSWTSLLTHEVHDQFADASPKNEVPHQVGDESEGDADQRHHQVTDGQWQQEQVSDRPHPSVPDQDSDDETVPQDTEQEDDAVEDDPHRLVNVWEQGPQVRPRETRKSTDPGSVLTS